MKHLPHTTAKHSSPLRKIVALIVTAVLVVLVLMFSAVLFAIIIVVGTIAWAYLWWKTRHLRRQMRDFHAGAVKREGKPGDETVVEGEVIRVVDSKDGR